LRAKLRCSNQASRAKAQRRRTSCNWEWPG
jgi:hypothetical protein